MKKTLLYAAVFFAFIINASAQSIPNGDFETWDSYSYELPQYYVQSSNPESFYRCSAPFNCVKTTDAYHGTFAVKMTTEIGNNDTCPGYFVNGNPQGSPANWHGGAPFNEMATGIRGYYKSDIPAGDSALILVNFSLAGTSIGFYAYKFYGTNSTYTPFSFTFNPALSVAPDSVMIGFTSSDFVDDIAMAGSMFQVDSVSLTGVTAQPLTFNGDFETWETKPIDIPVGWFINNSEGNGFYKSPDAYAGNYALEMQTYLSSNNQGTPKANAGNISTGYYYCDAGPCTLFGGYPYSNTKDTLAFYYKYAPSADDSAEINLNFKYNGSQTNSYYKRLGPAASYQYVEIPFDLGSPVDTAIVQMYSSLWADSSTIYVGSDLKVDDIHFLSQPLATGINTYAKNSGINIFPNPSTGMVNIQSDSRSSEIQIMNILGEKIYSSFINNYRSIIDLREQPKGVYFYELKSSGKIIGQGKLLIQ